MSKRRKESVRWDEPFVLDIPINRSEFRTRKPRPGLMQVVAYPTTIEDVIVNRSLRYHERWNVSHRSSGTSICARVFENELADALTLLGKFSIDWSRSKREISDDTAARVSVLTMVERYETDGDE